MPQNTSTHHPALVAAWKRYAEINANARALSKRFQSIRIWVAVLGVLTILFAILVQNFVVNRNVFYPIFENILKLILIALPISAAILAAFGNEYYKGSRYLSLRAASEEILKEIYIYRTVLAGDLDRHKRLTARVVTIQRQLYKSLGGDMVFKPYTGPIPPKASPSEPGFDPGTDDIEPAEYLRSRLEYQLSRYTRKAQRLHLTQRVLKVGILLTGALGAVLAALSGPFTIWVAVTAAILLAMTGWHELQYLDVTKANYTRVIMELTIIRDRWNGLVSYERSPREFFRMVQETENVLWLQNMDYIRNTRELVIETPDAEKEISHPVLYQSASDEHDVQESTPEEASADTDYGDSLVTDLDHAEITREEEVLPTGSLMVSEIPAPTVTHEKQPIEDSAIPALEDMGTLISSPPPLPAPEPPPMVALPTGVPAAYASGAFEDEIFDDEAVDADVSPDVFDDIRISEDSIAKSHAVVRRVGHLGAPEDTPLSGDLAPASEKPMLSSIEEQGDEIFDNEGLDEDVVDVIGDDEIALHSLNQNPSN